MQRPTRFLLPFLAVLLFHLTGCATTAGKKVVSTGLEYAAGLVEVAAAPAVRQLPEPASESDEALSAWLMGGGLTADEAAVTVQHLRDAGPCVLKETLAGFLEDEGLRRPIRAYGEGQPAGAVGQVAAARLTYAFARAEEVCGAGADAGLGNPGGSFLSDLVAP